MQDESASAKMEMQSASSSSSKKAPTIIGWDPTRAFALYVPTPVVETVGEDEMKTTEEQQQEQRNIISIAVNTLYSHPGTGCNEHELTALLQLLKAHDEYQQQQLQQQLTDARRGRKTTMTFAHLDDSYYRRTFLLAGLFRNYRAAISNCLVDWTTALQEQEQQQRQRQQADADVSLINKTTADLKQSSHNLELLRINYSVLHLSNVFLPLLPSLFWTNHLSSAASSSLGGDAFGIADAASAATMDAYMIPGLATAETVRYLRYNHISDLVGPDDPEIAVLLQAAQPENLFQNDDDGGGGEEGNAAAATNAYYWRIVTKLVLRGCLELAWKLLSHHSMLVAANTFVADGGAEEKEETTATIKDSMMGHRAVVSPDDYAAMMQDVQYGAFSILKEILLCAPLPGGRTDTHDNNVYDDYDDFVEHEDEQDAMTTEMPSVRHVLEDLDLSRADYKFWETKLSSSSSSSSTSSRVQDVPLDFQADAAKRKHSQWQEFIKDLLIQFQQDGGGPLASLLTHIPELKPVLVILSGDLRDVTFDTWAEKLLAELLYRQPDIRPANLSIRANKIAHDLCQESELIVVEPLLNIMEGNAAKAIDLLFSFGGGSGAALPTTLLALLFSLFVDASILPLDATDKLTDFLCEAAWAIQSSLASPSDRDMGVQLAVRLLLPYAMHSSVNNEQGQIIRSTIAQILEHYSPSAGHYAKTVTEQCRPLIERKSAQIMEACTSFLLNMYTQNMHDSEVENAIMALLDGIELEAIVLPDVTLGACHRTLTKECLEAAGALLQFCVRDIAHYDGPAAIANAVREAPKQSVAVEDIPEAMLAVKALQLWDAFLLDQKEVAVNVIAEALSQDRDSETGNRILRNVHWYFLRAAQVVLDDESSYWNGVAFDKEGMTKLMETLTELTSLDPQQCPFSDEIVTDLERCFAKGLARAFVKENTQKQETLLASRGEQDEFAGMQASTMHLYSESMQQRFVQHLLDDT